MQFQYTKMEQLPPLAWYADVRDGQVQVLHGTMVETTEDWFVEGAWSGAFAEGDFLHSDWLCGTGGVIADKEVVFTTPSHITSALFMVEQFGTVHVSNSLYFLLERTGLHLDPDYFKYEVDFNSILAGVNAYKSTIHVLDSNHKVGSVQILYYRTITIKEDNQIVIDKKKDMAPFANFADYETRLLRDMGAMYQNARHEKRVHPYGLVTMISQGYDAPCCATIVKKIGGDTALTFSPEGKYKEDSGVEIAKKLGFENIIERNAFSYKNREDMPEIDYLCSGELGAQIHFCVFDEDYKGNLVFSGDRGDSIWEREQSICNSEFHFNGAISHIGMSEKHLWADCIWVPMPYYGAAVWPSIHDISTSEEMKEWQLGSRYDRPIPRRIVEQAGVPRDYFGMEKRGAGFFFHYDWMKRILGRLSVNSAKDFKQYVNKHQTLHPIQIALFFYKTRRIFLRKLKLVKGGINKEEMSRIPNPMAARYLVPWAGEHMVDRYHQILTGESR